MYWKQLQIQRRAIFLFQTKYTNNGDGFVAKFDSTGNILFFDYFGGSGSTLIAAEKNGLQAFIMEFDPKFCDVIVKRWEDFTGKQAVLAEL